MVLSDSGLSVGSTKPGLRQTLGGRLLCGPRVLDLPLSAGRREFELRGASVSYFLLHSPTEKRTRITVTAEPGAALQVSLIALPAEMPRLELRVERVRPNVCRLRLTCRDADIGLTAAAWERLTTTGAAAETSFGADGPGDGAARTWFGDPRLRVNEVRVSREIDLPDGGEFVFRVMGRDGVGRAATAWAELGK
jgi:hypothetical protein